ncbi:hypothetical protein V7O62_09140 [Methanolobus sp. ZRKC2]|uniref:hypothetical protein n=1 Tax=Methanolobus sp. ZRKC2 TaxID=3125783 RepID=UPI003252000D
MQKGYIGIIAIIGISLVISFVVSPTSPDPENGTIGYFMKNNDNVNHTVTVEILDLGNVSKFNQTYNVAPDEN